MRHYRDRHDASRWTVPCATGDPAPANPRRRALAPACPATACGRRRLARGGMLAARSEQRRAGREERTALCPYARRPASRRAAALCDHASARRIWPRRRGDGFRGEADQDRGQSAPFGEPRRNRCLRAGRGAVALRSGPVAGDPQSRAKSATGPPSRAPSAPASGNMGRTKAAASGCSPGASLRPPCSTRSRNSESAARPALARLRANGGRRKRSGARGLWDRAAAAAAPGRRRYADCLRRRSAWTRPGPGRERPRARRIAAGAIAPPPGSIRPKAP